ncbi:MAG TPA: 2-phospho-L-lactate transferase [Actinomycetota bacterium]
MIVVLAGGVGAARFLRGAVRVVPPTEITVVGNTGDDIDIYGVHVSPDLDIVTYMLADVFDEQRGFGLRGDTHMVMDALAELGEPTWFALGDRDLAVCAARTGRLAAGESLSAITADIAKRFGVRTRILPMTDDPVHTRVRVLDGDTEREIHFQEYWVRHRAGLPAREVRLHGASSATPAPGVLNAIEEAEAVLLAPSNPVVSIGTILAVPGIRDAIAATPAPVVGVSPVIGGRVVRGMADKLLPVLGAEVSARGVAGLYADLLDGFVIDDADAATASDIAALGIRVETTATLMHSPEDAARLAKVALTLAGRA